MALMFAFLTAMNISAQELPALRDADSLAVTADTSAPAPRRASGARAVEDQLLYHQNKGFFASPTGALLRSVVIPGWGQWSNGKKQKAFIYAGVESYFFAKALTWRGRAADRLRAWEASCDSEGGCNSALFSTFDSARDRRNYFYWLLGTTIFVSMFDAYADRYLITLEQTRNRGDDFWGGQASIAPSEEWRVLATIRF